MAIPYSECQYEALLHLPWFSRGHRLIFLEPSKHPQHQPTTGLWILERAYLGKAYAVKERNSTTCREKLYFLKSNRLKSPGNHYSWYLGQIKFHSGNWPGYQIARANQPTVWGWERMVISCLSWFFCTKLWKVVGLEFSPSLFPLLQSLSHTCTHKRSLVINNFTYHDLQRLMIDFSFFLDTRKRNLRKKKSNPQERHKLILSCPFFCSLVMKTCVWTLMSHKHFISEKSNMGLADFSHICQREIYLGGFIRKKNCEVLQDFGQQTAGQNNRSSHLFRACHVCCSSALNILPISSSLRPCLFHLVETWEASIGYLPKTTCFLKKHSLGSVPGGLSPGQVFRLMTLLPHLGSLWQPTCCHTSTTICQYHITQLCTILMPIAGY